MSLVVVFPVNRSILDIAFLISSAGNSISLELFSKNIMAALRQDEILSIASFCLIVVNRGSAESTLRKPTFFSICLVNDFKPFPVVAEIGKTSLFFLCMANNLFYCRQEFGL